MARGRKPKSKFYHIRQKVGVNEEVAAEILGVTVTKIRHWDSKGAPLMAERLLLLWDRKNVGIEGWNGWLFSRGALMHKGKRWRPDMILDCQRCNDQLWEMQNKMDRLYTWRGLFKAFGQKIRRSYRR